MTEPTITMYLSKYALSTGVQAIKVIPGLHPTLVSTPAPYMAYYRIDDEIHATPEAALKKAGQMRGARIASLERQLAKLKAKTFTIKIKEG